MLPGLGAQAALAVVDRQGAALQARFTARRDNLAEVAGLRERAPRIADVDALLKDRRALRMVLEAFQLEGEIDKRAMIRRVLTEDPAEQSSLVNRLVDPRWRDFANTFAARRPVALTPDQVAQQTPDQLRALQINSMAALSPFQVQALTAEQVASLDPAQVAGIAPDAIIGLDAGDVAALTTAQAAALTPAQIRGLGAVQVAAIEPDDLAAFGTDQIRALGPSQIAALTNDQLGALTLDQVAAFTAAQAAAFTAQQLATFGDVQRATLAAALPASDELPPAPPRGPLDDRALLDRIVQGAMTNRFEKAMGEANPGLREALYFRRMAGSVTTVAQLMSDRALLEVARGALGLPQQFGLLSFEQQRDLITRRLDVTLLQDPKEVARMSARYLLQQNAAPPTSPVAALFDNQGGANGIAALAGQRLSLRA
jgi:hypothetical protein